MCNACGKEGFVHPMEISFSPNGGTADVFTSVAALVEAGYTAMAPSAIVEAFGFGADETFLQLVKEKQSM